MVFRVMAVSALACVLLAPPAQAEDMLVPPQGFTFRSRIVTDATGFHTETILKTEVVQSNGTIAVTHQTYDGPTLVPGADPTVIVPSPQNTSTFHAFFGIGLRVLTRPAATPEAEGRLIDVEYECDQAALSSFFPIGTIESVIVPCVWVSRFADRPEIREDVSAAFIYDGPTTLKTAFGEVPTQSLHVVVKVRDFFVVETRYGFDPTRGLSLSTQQTVTSARAILRRRAEIIELGP